MSETVSSQWQVEARDGFKIYQTGSHKSGNFVRAYVPDQPYQDPTGKTRAIAYLHGFALCMPQFYEVHLETLARQGYYVFFPDFQRSNYPDEIEPQSQPELSHLQIWLSLLGTAATALVLRRSMPSEPPQASSEQQQEGSPPLRSSLGRVGSFRYLRLSLALVLIFALISGILRWFQDTYGKNLISLLSTVALSLLYKPSEWMDNAITLTCQAWQQVQAGAEQVPEVEWILFGHSLGGLLALSWQSFLPADQSQFLPKQVLVADPAPSTEMGIPGFVILLLKLFRVPFATDPLTIAQTGPDLTLPVGILHGASDEIVKPAEWIKPPLFSHQTNFDAIASSNKQIYFSLSVEGSDPPLIAFHNQAVTDTNYYDDDLFENFGGVKDGPNAYNTEYIWPGLDLVIQNQAQADALLEQFPLTQIQVTETLTLPPFPWGRLILISLLVLGALAGIGYWIWGAGLTFSTT